MRRKLFEISKKFIENKIYGVTHGFLIYIRTIGVGFDRVPNICSVSESPCKVTQAGSGGRLGCSCGVHVRD